MTPSNLTLNRVAEISESNLAGAAPTGSLLVWIDQHLEKPNHPFDRTLSSEINLLSSLAGLRDELKDQYVAPFVQFKSFDSYPGYIPRNHGDFNDAPFWQQRFWEITTQEPLPNDLSTLKLKASKVSPAFNAYPKSVYD